MRRSGFELRDLPAEEAAESLRRLALWAVAWALQPDSELNTPSKDDAKDEEDEDEKEEAKKTSKKTEPVADFPGPLEADRLVWSKLRRAGKNWNKPPSFWAVFPNVFSGKKERKRRAWSHRQFAKALRSSTAAMPDTFYDLCATMAWSNPAFELELWESIRRWMFREMVYNTDLERNLGFSSQTLWTLIAIGFSWRAEQFHRQKWWRRWINAALFQRSIRRDRRLAEEFGKIAAARLRGAPNWAGFWDQWLLGLALQRAGTPMPEAGKPGLTVDSATKSVRKSPWARELFGMPFIRFIHGMDPYGAPVKNGLTLTASRQVFGQRWSEEAPHRLLAYYGYKKAPPPLPAARKTIKPMARRRPVPADSSQSQPIRD